ncbi:MAG: TetR family transcriptional regulator [Alphaproteobacteria bacterium]
MKTETIEAAISATAEAPAPVAVRGTRAALLDAAQKLLRTAGVAGLSTRRVAAEAGQPLSQIHYHFGSKQGLMLALLDHIDERVLARQRAMYESGGSLSARWFKACDFLDEDLDSGYVRLLQECIALGWSDAAVAEKVRGRFQRWYALLTEVAREAEGRFGALGPLTPAEVAALAGNVFLGAEALLLLRIDEAFLPIRGALRKIGLMIEAMERREARP